MAPGPLDRRRTHSVTLRSSARRAPSVSWGVLQLVFLSISNRMFANRKMKHHRAYARRSPGGSTSTIVSEPVETWGRRAGFGVVGSRISFSGGALGVRPDSAAAESWRAATGNGTGRAPVRRRVQGPGSKVQGRDRRESGPVPGSRRNECRDEVPSRSLWRAADLRRTKDPVRTLSLERDQGGTGLVGAGPATISNGRQVWWAVTTADEVRPDTVQGARRWDRTRHWDGIDKVGRDSNGL